MSEHTPTPGPWTPVRVENSEGKTVYLVHVFVEPSVCGLWSPPGHEAAEANARLIAASPWLAILARCFAAGWNLDRASLYDEEAVDGYRLSNGRQEFSWIGDIFDVDDQTYREVEATIAHA
jgi:hypothetical protein